MHSWLFGGVPCVFCILLSFFLVESECAVWFIYLGAIHTDLLIKYALVSQSMHLPHKLSRHSKFMFSSSKKNQIFLHTVNQIRNRKINKKKKINERNIFAEDIWHSHIVEEYMQFLVEPVQFSSCYSFCFRFSLFFFFHICWVWVGDTHLFVVVVVVAVVDDVFVPTACTEL